MAINTAEELRDAILEVVEDVHRGGLPKAACAEGVSMALDELTDIGWKVQLEDDEGDE